jgi:hypothetical protein
MIVKEYKWGNLIVIVDYVKGFDYTTVIEGVIKNINVEHKRIYNLKRICEE